MSSDPRDVPRARTIVLVEAPSNLGLSPPAPGSEPGTWRAPGALREAGLADVLAPEEIVSLERPPYVLAAQPGTRLRNGRTMREFNERLAGAVETILIRRSFPVVIGGDCSILLGCLAGARRRHELSLVHVDGHSDFYHPGNYDAEKVLGAVAGMDLALATGRGEAIMTSWDGRPGPLVPDERVVQIGEREGSSDEYAWPELRDNPMTQIDVFWLREHGVASVVARARSALDRHPEARFWLHLDVDVIDAAEMPAVDSPGSPGATLHETSDLIAAFVAMRDCLGMDVTVFDPEQDPDGRYARALVAMLGRGLTAGTRAG